MFDFKKALKDNNVGKLDPHIALMLDHIQNKRPSVSLTNALYLFSFNLLSSHRDPLSRQTHEAVRIQQAIESGTITIGDSDLYIQTLNRKGEHFAPWERWIDHQQRR